MRFPQDIYNCSLTACINKSNGFKFYKKKLLSLASRIFIMKFISNVIITFNVNIISIFNKK